jgi:hypothetical protein
MKKKPHNITSINLDKIILHQYIFLPTFLILLLIKDGFGGLVVSMLASGTQCRGFKPGPSRWIFTDVKILTMPSSGE